LVSVEQVNTYVLIQPTIVYTEIQHVVEV